MPKPKKVRMTESLEGWRSEAEALAGVLGGEVGGEVGDAAAIGAEAVVAVEGDRGVEVPQVCATGPACRHGAR
jgi:hypothetical protein